jgi:hypothetical protein
MHWTPRQYEELDIYEKALVKAFIHERIEEEKREAAKSKARSRKGGRR